MKNETIDNIIDVGLWATAIGLIVSAAIGVDNDELLQNLVTSSGEMPPLDHAEAVNELASIADTLPPETLRGFGIYFDEPPMMPQSTLEAYNLEDGRVMLLDDNIFKEKFNELLDAANIDDVSSNVGAGYAGGLAGGLAGYRSLRDNPTPTFVEQVRPDGKKAESWQHFNEQQVAAKDTSINRS